MTKQTDNPTITTGRPRVGKSEGEWRETLSPAQYEVLRGKGTEPPFTGKYVHEKRGGVYCCAGCGAELFSSETKFDSGTGWPSFTEPADRANVELLDDYGFGMHRIEVNCGACAGRVGHGFRDGRGQSPR